MESYRAVDQKPLQVQDQSNKFFKDDSFLRTDKISNIQQNKNFFSNRSSSKSTSNILQDLDGINHPIANISHNDTLDDQVVDQVDNNDKITAQREGLRGEIFSPEILEHLKEHNSDDDDDSVTQQARSKMKRQYSASKKRQQIEMNQIAQSLKENQGDEERKIMRNFIDEDAIDEEYRKATQAFFGQKQKKMISSILQSITEKQQQKQFSLDLKSTNNQSPSQYQKKQTNYIHKGVKAYINHLQRKDKTVLHRHSPTRIKKKDIHEFDLFQIQELRAHSDSIWVARFSQCGNYLATGGKDAVLKIWSVINANNQINDSNMVESWNVFNSFPYREYREHEYDILDIQWSREKHNLLLSCSLDSKVILWDLDKERHIQIFEHPDVPVRMMFNPELDNLFVTGSLDQGLRLWSIDEKNKPIDTMWTQESITALQYSENGKRLVVGLNSGSIVIYACDSLGRINYITRIECKNRRGKFSSGRKVSGIHFISKSQQSQTFQSEIIITTNDSRLRHLNLEDCIQKYKYKGHKNENLQIEASLSFDQEYIISGSEDGQIYIWNRIQDNVNWNKKYRANGSQKNRAYESFQPFEDRAIAPVALFVPKETLKIQMMKFIKLTSESFQKCLKGIIVACSIDGRLRVFINEQFNEEIKDEYEFEEFGIKKDESEQNLKLETENIEDDAMIEDPDSDEIEYQMILKNLDKGEKIEDID